MLFTCPTHVQASDLLYLKDISWVGPPPSFVVDAARATQPHYRVARLRAVLISLNLNVKGFVRLCASHLSVSL
jgi:hypothetical protein